VATIEQSTDTTHPQQPSSFQHTMMRALVFGVAAPMMRLMDATGLYAKMLHRFKDKVAARRLANNFGAYQPTAQDVLVCTFPKSGTNWMMQITFQIAYRGQGEFDNIHQYIPWPDGLKPVEARLEDTTLAQRSPFGLRIIKTHLSGDYLPYTPEAHYICVLRDPKDVFVSSYFFVRDVALGPMMPSVATWYDTFLSDAFFLGSWAQNLHDYWQLRHNPNVLVVTFEQMKADLSAVMRQVAAFLGVSLTEQELQSVYEKSTFEYMKGVDYKFNPPQIMPWSSKETKMLRKGQSGTSSELLTRAQQQEIDRCCREQLLALGSDFPYDEMFTLA
jgi:hypothetical protein